MSSFRTPGLTLGQPSTTELFLITRSGDGFAINGRPLVSGAAFSAYTSGVSAHLDGLTQVISNLQGCIEPLAARLSRNNARMTEMEGQMSGVDIASTLAMSRSANAVEAATTATDLATTAASTAEAAHAQANSALSFAHYVHNVASTSAKSALAAETTATALAKRVETYEPVAPVRIQAPGIAGSASLQMPPNFLPVPPIAEGATRLPALVGLVIPFFCDSDIEVSALSFIQSEDTLGGGTARQAIFAWDSETSTVSEPIHAGSQIKFKANTVARYTETIEGLRLAKGWYAYVIAASNRVSLYMQPYGISAYRDAYLFNPANRGAAISTAGFGFASNRADLKNGFALDATTELTPLPGWTAPIMSWAYVR